EHIGISLLGFGVGGLGVFAGAWHLMNHALAKSMAFYGTGLVFLHHNHRLLERVTGLLGRLPVAGTAILAAGVALAGLPPIRLFSSEGLVFAGAYTARPGGAFLFLALLAPAFGAFFVLGSRVDF